jgi:hypothetical protein
VGSYTELFTGSSGVAVLFGDKIRSHTKVFSYLLQLIAAKKPVHKASLDERDDHPINA